MVNQVYFERVRTLVSRYFLGPPVHQSVFLLHQRKDRRGRIIGHQMAFKQGAVTLLREAVFEARSLNQLAPITNKR